MLYEEYMTYHQPRWRVLISGLLVLTVLGLIIQVVTYGFQYFGFAIVATSAADWMVVLYASLYLGIWVLYFLSPQGRKPAAAPIVKWFCRVQSLRNLLDLTSKQRHIEKAIPMPLAKPSVGTLLDDLPLNMTSDRKDPFLSDERIQASSELSYDEQCERVNDRFQDKARTGITSVAILVATSVMVIRQCLVALRPAFDSDPFSVFDVVLLASAFTCAFTALLYFVIAIDDLDSMFNDFSGSFENCLFDIYFFRRSGNPRFIGLALLVFSVNLLVALAHRDFGALTLAISFNIIYSHVYPVLEKFESAEGHTLVRPGKDFVAQRWFILVITYLFFLAIRLNE